MTYISGPITGYKDYNKKAFDDASIKLTASGRVVFNPNDTAKVSPHKKWSDYMKEDISALMMCDSIYMLKGWNNSAGARIEHDLAYALGYSVEYEEE